MNVAELTTGEWLASQGFYVMPSVKFGRKEADFLAIRPENGVRLHVEVTVSSRPYGSKRSREEYERDAVDYIDRKFEALANDVRARLGGEYQKWLVIGKLAGGKEEEEVWQNKMLEHSSILVFSFDRVVREYVEKFRSRPAGLIGQLLDVLNELGLLRINQA